MSRLRYQVEQLVQRHPPQHEVQISEHEARHMIRSGQYQRSEGLFQGRHFRRAHGQRCFHLRVHEGCAFLHWDRWDPRRYPLQHTLETPLLWGPLLALLAGVVAVAHAATTPRSRPRAR